MFQKMAVKLGDVVPNFSAASTHGKIDFHTWCEVRIQTQFYCMNDCMTASNLILFDDCLQFCL